MSQALLHLPLFKPPSTERRATFQPLPGVRTESDLLTELQLAGLRWDAPTGLSRSGGAGPSDHKAITFNGTTLMVPIFTHGARRSRFRAQPDADGLHASLMLDGQYLARISLPPTPHFYSLSTQDGIPYWKIATLHSTDVLATTVLQTCTRFGHRDSSCQFCAIGQSLAAGSTIAHKTPEQLAEVAEAAVRFDGVKHMVLTTGTPKTLDRGAAVLADSARAIRERVDIPLQAQCEPPADYGWFAKLQAAGVDTLGMHIEAVTDAVRQRIMPGKAEVPLGTYLQAFEAAVGVFGRGQVTTYILAGLGDTAAQIIDVSAQLARRGVYPFVVPFVPISGTPLQDHAPPTPEFMTQVIDGVSRAITNARLESQQIKAGCGRCGACSTLRSKELRPKDLHSKDRAKPLTGAGPC